VSSTCWPQSHARAGSRNLLDTRDGAVLAASLFHRHANAPASPRPAIGCNTKKLLARPFMLAAMVLLAAAFQSSGFFRMGGVQKMVSGRPSPSGFMLYIMSKLTDDFEQGRAAAANDCSLDAGDDRRHDRLCRAFVPEDG